MDINHDCGSKLEKSDELETFERVKRHVPCQSRVAYKRLLSSSFRQNEKKHYEVTNHCRSLFVPGLDCSDTEERFRVTADLVVTIHQYNQYNSVERHIDRDGGIVVWAEISLGGHTDNGGMWHNGM
ncbi:hypothetical protein TNCV_1860981 [Trichonephila clavipes]|nr:hypothetical protein TNCV_1860981 [Trichonephila clavipes]